ncbi:uncharacterized protein [Dermacentor andersoni]|uniref:uncharacterized protein n=1 Tax=Dermacentor andersoni TaxID=34620 RepID=UPI002416CC72|nr:uncharacterized protein LOC129382289 [Dermacentor andersoni]
MDHNALKQLKDTGVSMVDNDVIAALANYARHQDINTFCIRDAHRIMQTLPLKRQFHLLNFSLPQKPANNRLPPSTLLPQPGLHDSAPIGSGLPAVKASSITGFDAEAVGSGISVEVTEHRDVSGLAMASSSKSGKRSKKPRRRLVTKSRRAPHWVPSTTPATP